MEESYIYGFLCRYREQLHKEEVNIRHFEIKLEDVRKLVKMYLQEDIKELDLCNFAWCLIFDDQYTYEEKNTRLISDVLFDIDSLTECPNPKSKTILINSIKQKLNINVSEL
jgi:hypothetical protein